MCPVAVAIIPPTCDRFGGFGQQRQQDFIQKLGARSAVRALRDCALHEFSRSSVVQGDPRFLTPSKQAIGDRSVPLSLTMGFVHPNRALINVISRVTRDSEGDGPATSASHAPQKPYAMEVIVCMQADKPRLPMALLQDLILTFLAHDWRPKSGLGKIHASTSTTDQAVLSLRKTKKPFGAKA